ncbi:hypothetical protein [Labilithrix luteola]|uniref:hypothetical protein n=1 Tax=Labilithrix luteola TaxID=1391654 RepID=UPI0011BADA43|nr:hypothetical protein [Labilithrix luteola]
MSQSPPELPGMIETADDGDRPSITDVNGTVARFEMAYSPDKPERFAFGPPLSQRIGSLLYMSFALILAGAVLLAYNGSSNSRLFTWIVEGDRHRPFGSIPLTIIVFCSALATVVRASLRGVIVTGDGVEARYLLPMGVPRIRKWNWAQIDRLVIADDDVMLELWNGTYEHLPKVRDGKKLADLLERIGGARGRTITRLGAKRAA